MPFKRLLKGQQEQKNDKVSKKPEIVREASHDESNWLVSYADMMTLLCGFFIMLFSMAKLDDPKYESMKEAVAKQFGGEYKTPDTKELAKFATQLLDQMGVEKQIVVKSDPGGVSILFQSTVFFDTLSADVKTQGHDILEKIAGLVAAQEVKTGKKYKIVVEGHTDSRPITGGTFPSNWELSGARAARVVRLFLDKGFAPENLTAIGYSDTRPYVKFRNNDGTLDEEALAKNRRVVLRILEPQMDSIPFPETAVAAPAQPTTPVIPATNPATNPATTAH